MAQGVIGVSKAGVPAWQYLLMVSAPFFLGAAMAIAITTYIKRIHRSTGVKRPYPVRTQYRMAVGFGFVCGAFAHWGLDETGQFLFGLPPLTIKAMLVTAILTAIFTPMIYDVLRRWSKGKENMQWLYKSITVHYRPDIDYTDTANQDITDTRFHKGDK